MALAHPAPERTLAARLRDLRLAVQRWRRQLEARLPFVRRRDLRRLAASYDDLIAAVSIAPPADACNLVVSKAPTGELGPELCLFVTYAPLPRLKRHVVRHVEALRAAGVKVILIVNTPHPPDRFAFDPALLDGLAGLYVRANEGFGFAAWAHAVLLLKDQLGACERLILTNDSIVGPLGDGPYRDLLDRVRRSGADVIGLTENPEPLHHLQSFFLAFGRRALASAEFERFWRGVRSLPTKELVILVYEIRLTGRLSRQGLTCEPMFRLRGRAPPGTSHAACRWADLVEIGLPFVKTCVLEERWGSAAVEEVVPAAILDEYVLDRPGAPS